MSREHALARARRVQERICAGTALGLGSTQDLYDQLKGALLGGNRSECLVTPPYEISALLRRVDNPLDRGTTEGVLGGVKDFSRTSADGWFARSDGARFNFSLAVQTEPVVTLVAYNFELVFPQGITPSFVRFDLNPPWQSNSDEGLRCHLHPGSDDVIVPSALLYPLELVELFVYGLRLPERRRA